MVNAGTCFPNEEEFISKSGEQIVKRAPMPPVQAAIYKKIEMVLTATKPGDQPNGHRTWLHNLTDSDASLSPGTYLGEGGAGTFISVATHPLSEDQKPYAWRFTRVTSHKRDSAETGNAYMSYIPDATAPPADGGKPKLHTLEDIEKELGSQLALYGHAVNRGSGKNKSY